MKKYAVAGVGVICLVVLWFSVYAIRSAQIDNEVDALTKKSIKNLDKGDEKEVKALKVVIDDKTYNVEEFMKLDQYPTTAQVIIAYADGTMEDKNCYISYNEEIKDFTYKDGVYGRILLPSKLSDKSYDETLPDSNKKEER